MSLREPFLSELKRLSPKTKPPDVFRVRQTGKRATLYYGRTQAILDMSVYADSYGKWDGKHAKWDYSHMHAELVTKLAEAWIAHQTTEEARVAERTKREEAGRAIVAARYDLLKRALARWGIDKVPSALKLGPVTVHVERLTAGDGTPSVELYCQTSITLEDLSVLLGSDLVKVVVSGGELPKDRW